MPAAYKAIVVKSLFPFYLKERSSMHWFTSPTRSLQQPRLGQAKPESQESHPDAPKVTSVLELPTCLPAMVCISRKVD